MTEQTLERVFAEVYRREFSDFGNLPRHRFSLRHKIRMRRIFSLFKKKAQAEYNRPRTRRKTMLVAAVIILIALISGCSAVIISRFISRESYGNQILTPANPDSGKLFITELFYIPSVPEGYYYAGEMTLEMCEYKRHMVLYYCTEKDTKAPIQLTQSTYDSVEVHYGGKYSNIEKITVGGCEGFYIEYSAGHRMLVWDNGDYIFELDAPIAKEELVSFAENLQSKEV